MNVRKQNGLPGGPPHVGANEILLDEATGRFYGRLADGMLVPLTYSAKDSQLVIGATSFVGGVHAGEIGNYNVVGGNQSAAVGYQNFVAEKLVGSAYNKTTGVFTIDAGETIGAVIDSDLTTNGAVLYSDDYSLLRRVSVAASDLGGAGTVTLGVVGLSDIEDDMESEPGSFCLLPLAGGPVQALAVGSDNHVATSHGNAFGRRHLIVGLYGFAVGQEGHARLYAQQVHAVDNQGQASRVVLQYATTNATPTPLYLDGVNDRIVLEDNTLYAFRATVVGKATSGDENAVYFFEGAIKRGVGAASVALVGTVTKTVHHEDVAAWDCDVLADVTNGAMEVRVTGEASTTIVWMGRLEWVEISV